MRNITLNGKVFEIKALTGKVFKAKKLEKYGYSFFGPCEPEAGTDEFQGVKLFVEASLSSKDASNIDDLTPKEYRKLAAECIKETYGSDEEEKNSQVSGTDSETKKK